MTNEETTDTNRETADENASERTSGKLPFEIPECCRRMMSQMTTGSCCDLPDEGEKRFAQNGSDPPGIIGRLIRQMMKACCGSIAARRKVAV